MLENNLGRLESQRVILVNYLKVKLDQEDWHGVSDAANDLRELDVAVSYLKEASRVDRTQDN